MRENADQNNSESGHFSRSDGLGKIFWDPAKKYNKALLFFKSIPFANIRVTATIATDIQFHRRFLITSSIYIAMRKFDTSSKREMNMIKTIFLLKTKQKENVKKI